MAERVDIIDYQPGWVTTFQERARELRQELGDLAVRIDHIGSTAVPGLASKPIIDIQISVHSLEPVEIFRIPLEALGYMLDTDNRDRSKAFFLDRQSLPWTNIHVREAGSWGEQFQLLFRDYLRGHTEDMERYAVLKRGLAERYPNDVNAYANAKGDFIWIVMRAANHWSMQSGWRPEATDTSWSGS